MQTETEQKLETKLMNCLANVIDSQMSNQTKLDNILKHVEDYRSLWLSQLRKEIEGLLDRDKIAITQDDRTKMYVAGWNDCKNKIKSRLNLLQETK